MTECPTCKLSMESHSTSELMECCMKQVDENLDENQKQLLKQYINNITNTTGFKSYVEKEIPSIVAELNQIQKQIKDKVTKIKLSETISVLKKTKIGKVVSDNHVSSLMISYELIKELKEKVNGK